MKKQIILIFAVFLLINTSIIVYSAPIYKPVNKANIIFIDNDNINGPWYGTIKYPYKKIIHGIENATENTIIFIFNGVYNETLKIDKKIKIKGEDKNETIIDGRNSDNIINIKKKEVQIKNLTVRNSGGNLSDTGIKIISNNNIIKNCNIYTTKTAIHVINTNFNEINNCTITKNGEAIHLENTQNSIVEGCAIYNNAIGLHIDDSKLAKTIYSYMHTNGIACLVNNSQNCKINFCNISDNSVNLGGIFIINSSLIEIYNCNIIHNGAGFSISKSEKITLKNCNLCYNTHFALSMREKSKEILIKNCEIKNNYRNGFYIEKDNIITIKKCNIQNNLLFGLYTKSKNIQIRYNYWDSSFGPVFTEIGLGSKINIRKIKTLPWYLIPIKNIGSNWKKNKPYMTKKIEIEYVKKFNFTKPDTDNDGVPDWWEAKWGYNPLVFDDHENIDEDGDALNNFEECYTDKYGSSPFKKDVFLEFDWMESADQQYSNKPPEKLLDNLVESFNKHDITLHYDIGDLDGGEEIPFCKDNYSFSKLRDLYWTYFLHNNINNPRKGIFHYSIICNYCPDLNFPFFGWDSFDSFAISAYWLKEKNPIISIGNLIVGASLHHLGHTLGLNADIFNGIDNIQSANIFTHQWFKYRNYKSSMNYLYKYQLFTYSDGKNGVNDFNDWDHLQYDFFKNNNFYKKEYMRI